MGKLFVLMSEGMGGSVWGVAGWSAEGPDGGALDVAVFERGQAGDVVAGQGDEVGAGQVPAAEVTGQDGGAAGAAPVQELEHPAGQVLLIEGVGHQDQV